MKGYGNDIHLVVMQINRELGYTETYHNTIIVLYYAMKVIIRSMSGLHKHLYLVKIIGYVDCI